MRYPDKPPPEGYRIVPEVAAAFPKVSPDGKTTTFKLRSGFRFSDGRPVDAEAFAWRLQFIFDHWQEASPSLRNHAMREARAFHTQWATRPVVENLFTQVRNPTGQFALRLAVRGAEPKSR